VASFVVAALLFHGVFNDVIIHDLAPLDTLASQAENATFCFDRGPFPKRGDAGLE